MILQHFKKLECSLNIIGIDFTQSSIEAALSDTENNNNNTTTTISEAISNSKLKQKNMLHLKNTTNQSNISLAKSELKLANEKLFVQIVKSLGIFFSFFFFFFLIIFHFKRRRTCCFITIGSSKTFN